MQLFGVPDFVLGHVRVVEQVNLGQGLRDGFLPHVEALLVGANRQILQSEVITSPSPPCWSGGTHRKNHIVEGFGEPHRNHPRRAQDEQQKQPRQN